MRSSVAFVLTILAAAGPSHGAASISTNEFRDSFASAGIVPDVLPAFNPSVSFYTDYEGPHAMATLLVPGAMLIAGQTGIPSEFIIETAANNTDIKADTRFIILLVRCLCRRRPLPLFQV